jgi:hypothetical protein
MTKVGEASGQKPMLGHCAAAQWGWFTTHRLGFAQSAQEKETTVTKMIVGGLAAAAVALGIAAGLIVATATAPAAVAAPQAPPFQARNPLTDDGMYQVPTEIAPGTYRYTVTSKGNGYWALCSDVRCEIGSGRIDTDWIPHAGATGYLEIPANAHYVKLNGLQLEPLR